MRASMLKFHNHDIALAHFGRVERFHSDDGWIVDVDGPAVRIQHPTRGVVETYGLAYSFTPAPEQRAAKPKA